MPNIPLFFFAFANDKARPLNAIPKEFNELDNLFLTKKQLCEAQFKPSISLQDFHHVISNLGKDIQMIHYGGHTDGYQTVFTDENQHATLFHGSGFVEMIKGLPNLQLVFINGCNSAQIVHELYDAGIPAVIGTTNKVNDTIAYQLSVAFYKGLLNQNTIAEAWTQATALIKGQYKEDIQFRGASFDDDDIYKENPNAAWFIKLHDKAGDWKLIPIKEQKFPRYHNINANPLLHKVIARDKDLEKVRKMLLTNQQCVVVNGIGGIGKTTLSRYYIEQYGKEYSHIIWLYENKDVYDIFFSDYNLLDNLGIKEQILDYTNKGNKKQAINLVMQKLNELQEPVLLVVDNVQNLAEFQYITQTLDKNKYHLLITSRQKTGKFPLYELGSLSEEEAKDLFCLFYYFNEEVEEEEILATKENPHLVRILKKASYHTLTVEILAGVLKSSEMLTLESLANELEQGVISQQLKQEIDTHYTEKEATIYETILLAFNISGISEKKKSFDLLAEWAVLPSFYIPQATLFTLIGINEENKYEIDNSLKTLIENAWVQKNTKGGRSYACHAVIQEAVRLQLKVNEEEISNFTQSQSSKGFFHNTIQRIKKVIGFSTNISSKSSKPDGFDYTPLIKRLIPLLYNKAEDNQLEKATWLPYSTSILSYLTAETEVFAALSNNTASIYEAIGDLSKVFKYRLLNIEIAEKVFSSKNLNLAKSYGNIAETFRLRGDFPNALKYGLKNMKIFEKLLSLEHPDLAQSYNNIAAIYLSMGNFSKSLKYGLKSIVIREKVLSPEHPNLATSYNNVANTYKAIGDLPKSLEYGLKSMLIFKKILSPEHPNLATSYNNIAEKYRAIGNLPKSLEYGLKSLAIREKVLSPEHPDLAVSYNNLASTYRVMNNLPKALEYGLKSMEIQGKIFSPEHPDLATSYHNIASTYEAMNNLSKSLEYGLKSMAIREKILSSEHPNLAASYNNIAGIYYHLEDYIKSLAYFQKAILILRKSLPKRHPNTKAAIDSMAVVLQAAVDAGQGAAVAGYKKWYEEEGKKDV